ncbi:MAG: dihydrolipoamide acetyltransferase family protein [Candidatus Atribacteria bacterium]|nr:dihydrolipoamide acetyltransferase family protein [Candidatus Atribacteria bacterium]
MVKKVIMPKLGLTMEEGVVNKWLVKEGERVEKGDALFEVATDKVNMEVESPAAGVLLKIVVEEGKTVPITETVAYIGEPGEIITETQEVPVSRGEKKTETAAVKEEGKPETGRVKEEMEDLRVRVSPLARRLVKEYNLDLSALKGTGPGGRIVREDVEAARQKATTIKTEIPQPAPEEKKAPIVPPVSATVREPIPLTRMRRIIAERMLESTRNKPHFFLQQEVWADELVRLREKLLPVIEKKTGLRLSYNDIMVKMVARSLEEFPIVNAYFLDSGIQMNTQVNVGIAVALDDGLIVPHVKNANQKGLVQLVKETNDLSRRAREGKLLPEEIKGGTFTISNLGMYGIDSFSAVINHPESAILACGAIKKKPFFNGEAIVPANLMILTLSGDHRIVDGAVAAKFIQFLKSLLEEPWGSII